MAYSLLLLNPRGAIDRLTFIQAPIDFWNVLLESITILAISLLERNLLKPTLSDPSKDSKRFFLLAGSLEYYV
jgi:hypothetical protein